MFVIKRTLKFSLNNANVYFKRFLFVTSTICGNFSLPIVYRIRFLQRLHRPKLQTVFLELTNKCNLKCKMCNYQSESGKTGFISKYLFENCVDQLAEIKISTLCLHFGGESLVHPEFKEFLTYAIRKRDQGGIGSVGWTENGMLFNQDIADLVLSLNLDFINFSIDGIGKINDEIRLGSKYSVIEKNIKYLLEKRGESKKPVIILNMVDYGKTEEQELNVYREWVHLVDGIDLIPSILPDNTWENKDLISKKAKMKDPPSFCHFPLDTLIISWDGKVTGCCLDYVFKINLGNVKEDSIIKIWKGSKFKEFRKEAITNTFSKSSPCKSCEFWKINFENKHELILNGDARMEYGYIYRKIRQTR